MVWKFRYHSVQVLVIECSCLSGTSRYGDDALLHDILFRCPIVSGLHSWIVQFTDVLLCLSVFRRPTKSSSFRSLASTEFPKDGRVVPNCSQAKRITAKKYFIFRSSVKLGCMPCVLWFYSESTGFYNACADCMTLIWRKLNGMHCSWHDIRDFI